MNGASQVTATTSRTAETHAVAVATSSGDSGRSVAKTRKGFHNYPPWAPRFWHGMLVTDWARLLIRNRFRVHPVRWGLATTISLISVFNSKMHLLQSAIYGHRIQKTVIRKPPLFIIGHWRSGTTYLHELLSQDEQFTSPTTYQCFAANHFLVTERVIPRLIWFLLPGRRPMDNVEAGWNAPQEDEFALCSAGVPSPYLRMAFPNHPDEYLNYLDMEGLSEEELERWKLALLNFVQALTLQRNKQVVLKSPTHTGRIGVLTEIFPEARFIHIVRDPNVVVPSTLRLWQSLDDVQGLQLPKHRDLEGYVFRAFERMYGGFEKQRSRIAADKLCEVRYEDLVADPLTSLKRVYQQLQLGDFSRVEEKAAAFVASKQNYKTNEYDIPDRLREEIGRRWATYAQRYGYRLG